MTDLSVGVLTADLLRLGEELEAVARAGVTQLHVDVTDGIFCPGITVGAGFVRKLAAARDLIGDREVMLAVDGESRDRTSNTYSRPASTSSSRAAPSSTASTRQRTRARWVHAVRRSRAGVTMTGVTKEG